MNVFIRFHRFLNLNNVKNIVYCDVPNHYISKKFQKSNADFPLNFLVRNTNLKYDLISHEFIS
jgi:hypothetical protein